MKIRNSRGISTFVAVLLLILLAVAAGVVIYAYTMGYFGNLGGTSTPGTISLDSATLNGTTHVMKAYIRNVGRGSVDFDNVYVDGTLVPDGNVTASPDPVSEGDVSEITVTYWAFETPNTYEIKIVAEDNTQLAFSVKATS